MTTSLFAHAVLLLAVKMVFTAMVVVGTSVIVERSGPFLGALITALPTGSYSDYLGGLLGGSGITVGSGGAVTAFTLPAHTVAVWQYTTSATAPQVGSINPN